MRDRISQARAALWTVTAVCALFALLTACGEQTPEQSSEAPGTSAPASESPAAQPAPSDTQQPQQ